jgi:hypothetical protein
MLTDCGSLMFANDQTCNDNQSESQCEPAKHFKCSWSKRAVAGLVGHLRNTVSSLVVDYLFADYFRFPGRNAVISANHTSLCY